MQTNNDPIDEVHNACWEGSYVGDAHYLIRRFLGKGECVGKTIENVREWFLRHGRGRSLAFGQISEIAERIAADMGIGRIGEPDHETHGMPAATDKAA